jgi:aminoglycoside phosphotransferase (APT) family kinase protein
VQGDTTRVRPAEQLDWNALASHLRIHLPDHLPGLDLAREMEILQFPGGHSNLTYLARFGGAELVVRRPPLGPVAPTAHDMAREYRWLAALHPVFPLAPRPYLLCEDTGVIGSVFYVMERRRGIVVRHDEPLGLAHRPEQRKRVSEALIDTLVDLHAVDVLDGPLATLGKPAGFVARQVRGWTERWQRSKLDDLPEMDALAAWLTKQLPPDPAEPTIVHGDYKLDNILLDPLDLGHVVAIFDWLTTVTDRPGWLSRDEIIERYAARSGRDLSGIRYYEVFALFKIAVVIQQIFFRFKGGQTDDQRFANFGERVTYLARAATSLLAAG